MNREEFDAFGNQCANNPWGGNEKECNFWWMQQHQEEFWSLIELLQEKNVKNILEIGSNHGGSLNFFHQIVGDQGLAIGVDPSESAFSVQKNSGSLPDNLKLVQTDSHTGLTKARIKKILKGRLLDFVFIDGDHSYEGCKKDYEMYSSLVRPGGLVGFHDVAIEPRVKKAFEEIDLPKQVLPVHFMGIGLVRV